MKYLNWKINLFYWCFFLSSVVCLGFLFPDVVKAQKDTDLSKSLPKYLGIYKLNVYGKKPQGLEEFIFFEIKEFHNQDIDNPDVDKNGMTFIDGELQTSDGTIYKFEKAFLKLRKSGEYEYFEFHTLEVKGITYTFKGKFLEREVQEVKGGSYTKVKGTLNKYKNARKLASAIVPLYEFAIL